MEIDAVDFQASTIEIARTLSADFPEIHYHCADIHQFGGNQSYDILLFSLALHHFSSDEAVRLLRRCRELSHGHVLVADLRRGWIAKIGVALLTTFLFREAMTRNDARVSAARAFSFPELENLGDCRRMERLRTSQLSFCPTGDLAGASVVQPIRKMRIISTIADLRTHLRGQKSRRVLVPTMGALHAGHVSLIRLARKHAGAEGEVAVSIFVNPLQFEPGSDFSRYPRPEAADEKTCRAEGVDLVFRPAA